MSNGHAGSNGESSRGSGAGRVRTESGRTLIQDSRLLHQAIRRGWINGVRWPTESTRDDLEKVEYERPLTMKESAALAVIKDINGDDKRIRQIAVKSAVAMEAQNQADEHKATPDLHLHAHKNLDKQPDGTVQKLASLAEEFEQVAGQDLLEE